MNKTAKKTGNQTVKGSKKALQPASKSTLSKQSPLAIVASKTSYYLRTTYTFLRAHWLGTLLILLATTIFFWPMITRISSYSEGGDAMFNAWTLSRDHHCIMRESCPNYSTANIYFPNKDTMLYSETQLSTGLLTLPLAWINQNPIFAYNVFTIISFFLSGWFMYLLVKHLSKGRELVAILAGVIFEFAPLKMAAIAHLQNLSIFYLPLAVLFIFLFLENKKRKYLVFLLLTLILQFYASWYQMVFVMVAIGALLVGLLLFKVAKWKPTLIIGGVVLLAVLTTLPLAKEYIRFSKANRATFSISDQVLYSSSLADYLIPHSGTIIGKIYYALRPGATKNSYNLDSYSYHGVVLYILAAVLLVLAYIHRKDGEDKRKMYGMVYAFGLIGLIGFILSLGPLLKVKGGYAYAHFINGVQIAIPAPYIFIDKYLPQLSFIRAVGRFSVLFLFALCCMLAYAPLYLIRHKFYVKYKYILAFVLCALVVIEILPAHLVPMSKLSYSYNLSVPTVYKYIKSNNNIDDIVVLAANYDYPGAAFPVERAEVVLWSGYSNKNIFNGYSGYTPPDYFKEYADFINFSPASLAEMKSLHLRYILVDKSLSSSKPSLLKDVSQALPYKLYEDNRYALFKI